MKKLVSLMLATLMLFAGMNISAEGEATVAFTDSAGRTVQVPKDITRIAPTGALTQIFAFALAPEYFVGLSTRWADNAEVYVRDYVELPVLGNLYGGSTELNLETLAALDPQIIIDVGEAKGTIAEDMDMLQEQLGIPVVHIDAYQEDYASAYRMLGGLLGLEERAEALASYCEQTYARVHSIMEAVGEENKKDLLYCLGAEGLNVIAKGSYHAKVVDLVANNLAVLEDFSSKGTGDPVDMEQLLLWDPEYIVFAADSGYQEVVDDPVWQDLSAVAADKAVQVPMGPYAWLGSPVSVQHYLGMLWLCDLLYPDAVDYNLQDEVTRYYELFYHCDLSEAQFESLTQNARVQ